MKGLQEKSRLEENGFVPISRLCSAAGVTIFLQQKATRVCRGFWPLVLLATMPLPAGVASGQKQRTAAKPRSATTKPATELAKLRDDYVKTTKEYKTSLQTLLTLYEKSMKKAEQQFDQSNRLFAAGLISKRDLENSEQAVIEANAKVTGARQQISGADTQIAQGLVEIQTEKRIAKAGRLPKGSLVQTTSFIRYNGGLWLLTQAGKIQDFFLQKFGRPLPIAVFGQGAIHNQWRLDHHNAMDVSVYPDTAEGQALMDFLRSNGIPFSAFRTAIPGVATGAHIHIGLPSHRY